MNRILRCSTPVAPVWRAFCCAGRVSVAWWLLVVSPAAWGAQPPTGARSELKSFQPGVWIDWQRRAVYVQTEVVLRQGPLEFLACWAGKEHESIVRCIPPATHVYMALGLIGLQPGHPPERDQESGAFRPPAGDLVEISFLWQADDGARETDAFNWLRELEYERQPLSRPWVFAGSRRRADDRLASDVTGVGVALVDFEESLIAYSRRYRSDYSALWVAAESSAIPELGTEVWMVLRPAKPRDYRIVLDWRGVLRVDGRYCTVADAVDLLTLGQRLQPQRTQRIDVRGALRSDVQRWDACLRAAGLPSSAFELVTAGRREELGESASGATNPGSASGAGVSAGSRRGRATRSY